MMVTIWKKGCEKEREKILERETDLAKGGKRERKKQRPNLVVAHDGDDWCGGGGLWTSNERPVRRESSR